MSKQKLRNRASSPTIGIDTVNDRNVPIPVNDPVTAPLTIKGTFDADRYTDVSVQCALTYPYDIILANATLTGTNWSCYFDDEIDPTAWLDGDIYIGFQAVFSVWLLDSDDNVIAQDATQIAIANPDVRSIRRRIVKRTGGRGDVRISIQIR